VEHAAFNPENKAVMIGYRDRTKRTSTIRSSQGQVLVEFALVLPLLLLLAFGVIELSFLMHDQHVIIRLTREGSNLISRSDYNRLDDAATVMTSMVNPPVDFSGTNSKLIFTVLKKYTDDASQPNYNKVIVYQRREIGGLTATSVFNPSTLTSASFGPAPEYYAINPGTNTNLQATNVPTGLVSNAGQFAYVTEIYTLHPLITALNKFGVSLPTTLYSIAYF
jgi:Flp pilus assembly protein TadG